MLRLVAVVGILVGVSASPAAAQGNCFPTCDFLHYYGSYDLSWQRPGLTCYARCDRYGNCAPTPACFVQAPPAGTSAFVTGWLGPRAVGRITVRSRRVPQPH